MDIRGLKPRLMLEGKMDEIVMVSAVRTPIGAYLGALSEVPAYKLGALVLEEAVRQAGVDPAWVDEVIMG
jgi:acetyl-CoA C-acetyltransferase